MIARKVILHLPTGDSCRPSCFFCIPLKEGNACFLAKRNAFSSPHSFSAQWRCTVITRGRSVPSQDDHNAPGFLKSQNYLLLLLEFQVLQQKEFCRFASALFYKTKFLLFLRLPFLSVTSQVSTGAPFRPMQSWKWGRSLLFDLYYYSYLLFTFNLSIVVLTLFCYFSILIALPNYLFLKLSH